ncbi:hypothetical protein [Streptomyces sp. NPDC012510]|uniref:hypothetical protein n=1 Tax=Streptomyces sp. NPDC012510 TaxID=3364838 RepID=UPI0036E8904C
MSGRLRRLVGTATLTALTAGALLGMPLAPAVAAPGPPAADESADAATAGDANTTEDANTDTGTGTGTGPEASSSGTRSLARLLADLQRLHREAEQAAEAFTATDEELAKQRGKVATLDQRLAVARLSLHHSRGAAGQLARQQYQNSSTALSPYVRLLMARDPHRALEQGHVIDQVARERARTVERMVGTEQDTDALARRARVALDRQLTLAERRKREHNDVRDRLDEIEDILAALTPRQLTAVEKWEKSTTGGAGLGKVAPPKPSSPQPPATSERYARVFSAS